MGVDILAERIERLIIELNNIKRELSISDAASKESQRNNKSENDENDWLVGKKAIAEYLGISFPTLVKILKHIKTISHGNRVAITKGDLNKQLREMQRLGN